MKAIHSKTYILTLVAIFHIVWNVLGGIWAINHGEDLGLGPKENGALLIVMWHLMMLHMSQECRKRWFALGTSLVNIIVALLGLDKSFKCRIAYYGFTDSIATNLFLYSF